jgi:hypothetical protein
MLLRKYNHEKDRELTAYGLSNGIGHPSEGARQVCEQPGEGNISRDPEHVYAELCVVDQVS